jgi:deazaflavin-dependent oxidoreductase (nitroreductase family)
MIEGSGHPPTTSDGGPSRGTAPTWQKRLLQEHRENHGNERVISEFRANGGRVGGQFAGSPMLLLHHIGRRSGHERVTPLSYQPLDGGRWAIFGTKAGAPKHPDWYLNLVAGPRVKIEVDGEVVDAVARVTEGDERDVIWDRQKHAEWPRTPDGGWWPRFAEYEAEAGGRVIPVVVLERAGAATIGEGAEHAHA